MWFSANFRISYIANGVFFLSDASLCLPVVRVHYPPWTKPIDHLQKKQNKKKTATQLIPKQMWWALATVHPLWAFWCGETCWSAVSSFSNKAVISCQCALSWRGSKLAEINSACQGRIPRRNKAGRHMVSRPQGGSRQRSDWIWTPISTRRHNTVFTHGMAKETEKKKIGHAWI